MQSFQAGKTAIRGLGHALFGIGLIVSGSAASSGQDAPGVVSTAAVAPIPTDEQLANAKCISGMQKFLPGEYFYCLAAQSYGQNQHRYAEKFFKEAASWASKPADYVLGVMALNGDQQPANPPLALAWFELAAERHTPRFQEPYDQLRARLGAADLAKADAYVATLRRTYGDEVAAPRAEARYRDGVARLPRTAAETNYCIEGARDYRASAGAPDAPGGTGGMQAAQACGTTEAVVKYVDGQAADVFEGWSGHVTVGAVAPVTGPGVSPR